MRKAMKKSTSTTESNAPAATSGEKVQKQQFAAAMKAFNAGQYKKAKELFEETATGPTHAVSEPAKMYARMCLQRLQRDKTLFESAEDHYNFAVKLINERKLTEAQQHLEKAAAMSPEASHVYYALALAVGLQGNLGGAREHLKRAIELDPQSRVLARSDGDFQELLQDTVLRDMIYPERAAAR